MTISPKIQAAEKRTQTLISSRQVASNLADIFFQLPFHLANRSYFSSCNRNGTESLSLNRACGLLNVAFIRMFPLSVQGSQPYGF